MAYEAETIAYSQKIFYYLLCHGALSDLDAGANELYRAYVEHEEVMNLVKNQAEIADCRIERYGTCLKYNIVPFSIEDDLKMFYYRGLKEWGNEKGYLTDTCLTAQDKYKVCLNYSRIMY